MNDKIGLTNGCALKHLHTDKRVEHKHSVHNKGVAHEINGFTNGAGSGFTNGARKGLTNGAGGGFVNGAGKGFVNGSGLGLAEIRHQPVLRLSRRQSPWMRAMKKAFGHEKFKPVMALIIVIALVSTIPQLAMHISQTVDKIMIDGVFKDWDNVPLYTDAVGDVKNQNIDIISYGRLDQDRFIYIYLSGANELLTGNGTKHDTIILMMDTDGRRITGYQVNGLGYDHMTTVSGYGGQIVSKSSFVYAGNGNNWNDWEKRGTPCVEMKNNHIEFKIDCYDSAPVALDVYIVSADGEVEQIDGLLSTDYMGYRVYQYAVAEVCVGAGITPITNLLMICDANVTEISQITFRMAGTARDNSFGRFSLADNNNSEIGYGFVNDGVLNINTNIIINQNQMVNYTLSVNILENESADTFLFYIDSGYDFASDIVPRLYNIYKNYSYIGYIPKVVTIDGGFGEWHLEPEINENEGIMGLDKLCILASDSCYGDNTYAMALKYYGTVVEGDIMPIFIENGDGNGAVANTSSNATLNETITHMIPEDPITGEDILIITIGSDRRVEIRGKDCKITKSVFAILSGGNWTETGSIESFCDERNLEFAINNVTVSDNDIIKVISSNWNNEVYFYNHTHSIAYFEFNELNEAEPIEPMGTITQMSAYEHNATKTITIDGVFDDRAWADKSTCQYVVDLAYDIKVSVQRSSTQLYIAVFAIGDTTDAVEDACDVYFDTWNAGNTAYNNASYKRLRISGTGAITYYEGSAGGWALVTTPSGWTCADATTTYNSVAYRTYEFSVPLSGIDTQGRFGAVGETVGFSAHTRNYLSGSGEGASYRNMYYPDYLFTGADTHRTPNNWADLVYASDFVARDYALEVDATSATITIDGSLSESAWTNDATFTYVYDPHGVEIMEIYYMRDATYLYVGLSLIGDIKYAGQDFAQLLFDTDYDQTTLPDAGDKSIQITEANVTTYYEGSGTAWVSATLPTNWLARSAYTGGESSYEFRMTLTELDENGNFGQDGDVIGFMSFAYRYETNLNNRLAIYFPDGSQKYVSFITTRNFPSVYGELVMEIPELDAGLGAMGMLLVGLYVFKKRREERDDKREGEQRG